MTNPPCPECTQPLQGFWVEVTGREFLRVEDFWPDGDGPANPTAEDAAAQAGKAGGVADFLRDWNMASGVAVSVGGVEVFRARKAKP